MTKALAEETKNWSVLSDHLMSVNPATVKFYDIESNWDIVKPILESAVADKIIRRCMAKKSRDKRDNGLINLIEGRTDNKIWLHHVSDELPEGHTPEMSDSCDWRFNHNDELLNQYISHIEWDEETEMSVDENAFAEACEKMERENPMPAFWNYVCHTSSYWMVDLNFYLANMLMPEENWFIVQNEFHATVVNESGTLLVDMNYLALYPHPDETFEMVCHDEYAEFYDWFTKCGHPPVPKVDGKYQFDANLIETKIVDHMAAKVDAMRKEFGMEPESRR